MSPSDISELGGGEPDREAEAEPGPSGTSLEGGSQGLRPVKKARRKTKGQPQSQSQRAVVDVLEDILKSSDRERKETGKKVFISYVIFQCFFFLLTLCIVR